MQSTYGHGVIKSHAGYDEYDPFRMVLSKEKVLLSWLRGETYSY